MWLDRGITRREALGLGVVATAALTVPAGTATADPGDGDAAVTLGRTDRASLDLLIAALGSSSVRLTERDPARGREKVEQWYAMATRSDRVTVSSGLRTVAALADGSSDPRQLLERLPSHLPLSGASSRTAFDLDATVTIVLGLLTSGERQDALQQLIDTERWSGYLTWLEVAS